MSFSDPRIFFASFLLILTLAFFPNVAFSATNFTSNHHEFDGKHISNNEVCVDPPTGISGGGFFCFGTLPYPIMVDDPGPDMEINWYNESMVLVSNDNPFNPTTAGTYYATIFEPATGCESTTVSIAANESAPIVIMDGEAMCADDLMSYDLEIMISGGSGNYPSVDVGGLVLEDMGNFTYLIKDIPTNTSASIFVTDEIGCTANLAIIAQNCDCPFIETPTGGTSNFMCFGGTPTPLSIDDPGVDYIVNWYHENGTFAGTGNPFTPESAGIYTARLQKVATDCVGEGVEVELVEGTPSTTTVTNQICNSNIDNYDLTFEVAGDGGPYQISSSSFTINENGNNNYSISGVSGLAGTTIEITDGNNCVISETIEPMIMADPVAEAGAPQLIDCANPIANLDASSSEVGTYQWTGPAGFTSNEINPSIDASGTYYLEVINSNACSSIDSVEVVENFSTVEGDAQVDVVLNCTNQQAILTPFTNNDQVSYSWTGPNGFNTIIPSPAVSEPGLYELVMTDENTSCTSEVIQVLVERNLSTPIAEIETDHYKIDCISPSGEIEIFAPSSTPEADSIEYKWLHDGTELSNGISVTANTAGTYELQIKNILSGCIASDEANVEVDMEAPFVDAGPAKIINCYESEVILYGLGSSSSPSISYQWTGPGIASDATEGTIMANEPGEYTLTLVNTENHCEESDVVLVTKDIEPPIADAGSDQVLDCYNNDVILGGTNTSVSSIISHRWTYEDGTILPESTSPETVINTPGTYYLEVFNNDNGCSATDLVKVIEETNVPQDINATTQNPLCNGYTDGALSIDSIIGGVEPYLYAVNGSSYSTERQFSNLPAGTYDIAIQDLNGCELTQSFTINEPPPLVLELGPDVNIELGEEAPLRAQVYLPIADIASFEWTTAIATLSCDTCFAPVAIPTENTIYQATVFDINGCTTTDNVMVYVNSDHDAFIPNIFSPNNDGKNDYFKIEVSNQAVLIKTLQIYSRNGALVYQNNNFDPFKTRGWNGLFNGKVLNPGVFVYYTEVEYLDGAVEVFKGDVTLVR